MYRAKLRALDQWDEFLLAESGLPGPRANLELLQVVADEGSRTLFKRYVALAANGDSTNSPQVYLVICGVVGLGRLLAEGDHRPLATLRDLARDPRWRVREGVAMALQRWGDADLDALLAALKDWSRGTRLEQRAVVAAVCEPRLLRDRKQVKRILKLLDDITRSIVSAPDRSAGDFKVLRQTLGYGWSVAVAALPEEGKHTLERWFVSIDSDVRWIMRENLKKTRLARLDAPWVKHWSAMVGKR
ncbi:MAG: hypothetical protein U0559_08895 [Anaerolineae bacterium]